MDHFLIFQKVTKVVTLILFKLVQTVDSVMSDSATPGLYSPWNSSGQNTGVGSRSLLQRVNLPNPWIKPRSPALRVDSLQTELSGKPKVKVKVTQSCLILCSPGGSYSPWNPPGQNTGVGSLSLPQWVFPTQGSNQGLLHCRRILYQLSDQGSPICYYMQLFSGFPCSTSYTVPGTTNPLTY